MSLSVYDVVYTNPFFQTPLYYYKGILPIYYSDGQYFYYYYFFSDGKGHSQSRSFSDISSLETVLSSFIFFNFNGVLFYFSQPYEGEFMNLYSTDYDSFPSRFGKYWFAPDEQTLYSSADVCYNVLMSRYFDDPDSIPLYGNRFLTPLSIRLEKPNDSQTYYYIKYRFYELIGFLPFFYCCYPDFAPILRNLGGVPVTDQSQNLKMICQLLGVDTNTTLNNCEAMKEYLKRVVQVLGGFPQNEPNDNLKIICDLLGVDSDPQGLSDCDLSKDYVKRISKMLGAE